MLPGATGRTIAIVSCTLGCGEGVVLGSLLEGRTFEVSVKPHSNLFKLLAVVKSNLGVASAMHELHRFSNFIIWLLPIHLLLGK